MIPSLTYCRDDGRDLPVLVWRPEAPWRGAATSALGGGLGPVHWAINLSVGFEYTRMDPDIHLDQVARSLGLDGPGVGLMTAIDVAERVSTSDGGVHVTATVGLGYLTWAAAPDGDWHPFGTINVLAQVPVPLSDAALVNAVVTATEAKVQALWELGIRATGTASDALCVVCPSGAGPAEPYGGPRSTWGARLARAVHAAVRTGAEAELRNPRRPR